MKLCVLLLVFALGATGLEEAKRIYRQKYEKYFNADYISISQYELQKCYQGEMNASDVKILFLGDDDEVVNYNVEENGTAYLCEWECQTLEMSLRNYVRYSTDTPEEKEFKIQINQKVKFVAGTNGLLNNLQGEDFIVVDEFGFDQQSEDLNGFLKGVTNAILYKFANEATLAYIHRK